MKTTDIYWLAGMIEGEGCIHLLGRNGITPQMEFSSTDIDIAIRVSDLFGASLRGYQPKNPRHKINYRVTVMGRKAVGWMMTLYPIMGRRRRGKIREVLAAWRTVPNRAKRGDCIW